MRRLRDRILRLCAKDHGSAAIEFAFIAPVLILALLTAYDLSRMVETRRGLVSVVRAGVEAGLRDGTGVEADISRSMLVATRLEFGAEALQSTQRSFRTVCACPGSPGVEQPCGTPSLPVYPCGTSVAPLVFYVLKASTMLDLSVMPQVPLQATAYLQKR